jgi:regulator of protease activity HflC (stomatin/prohibitin superfamily)
VPEGGEGLTEDDELTPLGAAATLPAGTPPKDRKPRERRKWFRRGGSAMLVVVLIIAAVVLLAFVPAFASGLKKTPRDRVGISYGGGPIEGSHFQRIVKPGHALFFNGLFDPLYLYPADQQSYIVSKTPGQGNVKGPDSIVAPTKDRVQVEYQIAAYFKLDTDRLRDFHEQLGLRYKAYTSSGWDTLIQNTFRQQIENALQQETRRYDVADIYGSDQLLRTLQADVQTTLTERLKLALGQQYFCGPTFTPGGECSQVTFIIKKIDIPKTVSSAFENQRAAQIGVLTRQEEAQGINALNDALAKAGENYVLLRAIESGKINFWVLPSGSGLTLQTQGNGTAPQAPSSPPTSSGGGG